MSTSFGYRKAKAGMVHSVSGWTRGVQVKLWDPLRTRAIPERLRGVFTTRRYPRLSLPYQEYRKINLENEIVQLGKIEGRQHKTELDMAYAALRVTSHNSSTSIRSHCNARQQTHWLPRSSCAVISSGSLLLLHTVITRRPARFTGTGVDPAAPTERWSAVDRLAALGRAAVDRRFDFRSSTTSDEPEVTSPLFFREFIAPVATRSSAAGGDRPSKRLLRAATDVADRYGFLLDVDGLLSWYVIDDDDDADDVDAASCILPMLSFLSTIARQSSFRLYWRRKLYSFLLIY